MARQKEIKSADVVLDFKKLSLEDQVSVFKVLEKELNEKKAQKQNEIQLLETISGGDGK